MKEEWRSIGGSSHYEVSNFGNVRSWRLGNGKDGMALLPKMLIGFASARGYRMVQLGRQSKRLWVHRLVLAGFVGERKAEEECRHVNGVRDDNRLENLRWSSHDENMRDQYIHGTRIIGETHPRAYLNDRQVKEIHHEANGGKRGIGRVLAERYGCSEVTISQIKKLSTRKEAILCVSE